MSLRISRGLSASRWFRPRAFILVTVALALCGVGVLSIGYLRWGWFRSPPTDCEIIWAKGVRYIRTVVRSPRLAVIHVVEIDQAVAEVDAWTTPPDDPDGERPFRARTTTSAVQEFGLIAAVNGDFFHPQHAKHPFDYFPGRGQAVAVAGPVVSEGATHHPKKLGYFAKRGGVLTVTTAGDWRPGSDLSGAQTAVSGGPYLVRDGQIGETLGVHAEAQTAVAFSRNKKRCWLVVVDGRQPNYSEGLTDTEFAHFLKSLGAEFALRLDGGGSSTLSASFPDSPRVINSPIHAGVPGVERPVANHFGIKAR